MSRWNIFFKGRLYKIIDEDIIFNANNLIYRIEILPENKYYAIQLYHTIENEEDVGVNAYLGTPINSRYRYAKVRAYDKAIIFETIFEMAHPSDFKLKFTERLNLLQEVIELYLQHYNHIKEQEKKDSEPQQEIRTVGEA